MNTLSKPDSLQDEDAIDYREERLVTHEDDLEYYSSVAGLAAVGLTSEDGSVLLIDSPHGWRLPYGPNESDTDWMAAGTRIASQLTNRDVSIEPVERVTKLEYELESDSDEQLRSRCVVLRADSVAGNPTASSPAFEACEELLVADASSDTNTGGQPGK